MLPTRSAASRFGNAPGREGPLGEQTGGRIEAGDLVEGAFGEVEVAVAAALHAQRATGRDRIEGVVPGGAVEGADAVVGLVGEPDRSGTSTMACGTAAPLPPSGIWYCTTVPRALIVPSCPVPRSANQMMPSAARVSQPAPRVRLAGDRILGDTAVTQPVDGAAVREPHRMRPHDDAERGVGAGRRDIGGHGAARARAGGQHRGAGYPAVPSGGGEQRRGARGARLDRMDMICLLWLAGPVRQVAAVSYGIQANADLFWAWPSPRNGRWEIVSRR